MSVFLTWQQNWRDRLKIAAVVICVVALASYPMYGGFYTVSILRDGLIFGLFALALDFFWGKTGEMSFGHGTFFGLGAYGMAILTIKGGIDPIYAPWLGLLLGIILAGIVAFAVGYFLIFGGVRGAYFTVVTLALTVIAESVAIGWSQMTGGNSGLIGVPPLTLVNVTFMGDALYYLVLGVVTVTFGALWWFSMGRYGRILAAIQDHEERARALGHNTSLIILLVFTFSAMLSGLAGAIYVSATGFVAPDMIGLILSTNVILWVVVGGRGTLLGPIIGAFVVIRLQQSISSINTNLWPLILGVFFVLVVFLFPKGVISVTEYGHALIRRIHERRL